MKVKFSTIVRIVALFAVLCNQVLAIFGRSLPFTDDAIYQTISILLTIVVALYAAWKNNDFTSFALLAGKIFEALKDGKVTKEEVEAILSEGEFPVAPLDGTDPCDTTK